jgi:uncharacterized protein (TIGR03435 family)
VTGTGQTIAGLASMLSGQFDRMFLDMTGLTGKYDFSMRFNGAGIKSDAADDPSTPDIFAEMRRLGLRMESRKAPIDVLVIDYAAQQPTEN